LIIPNKALKISSNYDINTIKGFNNLGDDPIAMTNLVVKKKKKKKKKIII
jgi:hypothetical protein